MTRNQMNRLRCGDCGAEVDVPCSPNLTGTGVRLCCRLCGAELQAFDLSPEVNSASTVLDAFNSPRFVLSRH